MTRPIDGEGAATHLEGTPLSSRPTPAPAPDAPDLTNRRVIGMRLIMTTVTTVLGLLPMALGIGRGSDLRAPLAIAVIGGLLVATALTLIVVPVVYQTIEKTLVGVGGSPEPQPAAGD